MSNEQMPPQQERPGNNIGRNGRQRVHGRILVAVALAAALLAPSPGRADATIRAAYVLYAQSKTDGTVLLARVVTDRAATCPSLDVGGRKIAMIARRNPNPQNFPVTVCEALYPFDQAGKVAGTDIALPKATRQPQRIALFGDTGCKGLKKNGKGQDCADPDAWPFPKLAQDAAASGTDLVIHVGDYNYIGTPSDVPFAEGKSPRGVYDAGDHAPIEDHCRLPGPFVSQNAAGSLLPDHWGHWWQDFFEPARPLLAAAPWIFARGNHELCSRAGPGWFYFLSPLSTLLGDKPEAMRCPPAQSGPLPVIAVPPYRVAAGALDIAVMDTTLACDAAGSPDFTEMFAGQFDRLPGIVRNRPTWLVTHRPIWGVVKAGKPHKKSPDKPVKNVEETNKTLQLALRLGNGGKLPPTVRLVLAGHMHRFQSVTFASGRPPVLTVGDSGTKLDAARPTGTFVAPVDGETARIVSENMFGYIAATVNPDGSWHGRWRGARAHRKKGASDHKAAACGTDRLREGSLCALDGK